LFEDTKEGSQNVFMDEGQTTQW